MNEIYYNYWTFKKGKIITNNCFATSIAFSYKSIYSKNNNFHLFK